jgi:hypothetical protein
MVQSTPPTCSRDGMPLFSDPRFTEHLYHYQCRYLNDTTHRVDRIAPQVDRLQQDLREMSANFSFLRNTFQHFVDMHFVPLQDHIFTSGPPTLTAVCKTLARFSKNALTIFCSRPDLGLPACTEPYHWISGKRSFLLPPSSVPHSICVAWEQAIAGTSTFLSRRRWL